MNGKLSSEELKDILAWVVSVLPIDLGAQETLFEAIDLLDAGVNETGDSNAKLSNEELKDILAWVVSVLPIDLGAQEKLFEAIDLLVDDADDDDDEPDWVIEEAARRHAAYW